MFQLRLIGEIDFFITENRHFRTTEWTNNGIFVVYDDRDFSRNWRSPRGLNV